MLRKWEKPELEMLDVSQTMSNLIGKHHDGAWNDHISNEVPNGDGLSEAQMS